MILSLSANCPASLEASRPILKEYANAFSLVTVGSHDGTFDTTADTFNSSGYGLEFGDFGGNKRHAFFRIGSIGIPADADIVSAELQVLPEGYLPTTLPAGSRLYAVAEADPSAPTNFAEAEAMLSNLTTAYLEFNDDEYDQIFTLDVTDIVKELQALSGWAWDSAILFVATANTATSGASLEASEGYVWPVHFGAQYLGVAMHTLGAACICQAESSAAVCLKLVSIGTSCGGSLEASSPLLGDAGVYAAACTGDLGSSDPICGVLYWLGATAPAVLESSNATAGVTILAAGSAVGSLESADIAGWRELILAAVCASVLGSSDARAGGPISLEAECAADLTAASPTLGPPSRTKFAHANGEIVFSRSPERPKRRSNVLQPAMATAAGAVVGGAPIAMTREIQLAWPSMTPQNYAQLLAFYETVVNGSAQTFAYLAAFGQLLTVRFAPGLPIQMTERALDSLEVRVNLWVE